MRHWQRTNFYLFLFALLISTDLFAASNSQKVVERFDIGQYRPQKYGLKDLVFNVRIENLLEQINASQRFGKLRELYFRVYWIQPQNRFKIDVVGLPASFAMRQMEFVNLIKDKLDFVIPQKLENRLENFRLKFEKLSTGSLIRGVEKSQKRAVSEYHVFFDKQGKMSRTKTFATTGVVDSTIVMGPKSWSNNKWVVEKIITKAVVGQPDFETTIAYSNQQGFGFPKTIEVKAGKTRATKIIFDGYEVNTGKALKEIKNGR